MSDEQNLKVPLLDEMQKRMMEVDKRIGAIDDERKLLLRELDDFDAAMHGIMDRADMRRKLYAEASGNSVASASGLSNESSIQDQSPQPSSKGEEDEAQFTNQSRNTDQPPYPHQQDVDLPEGFIAWSCGDNDDFVCPVPLGTVIQFLRRDNTRRARKIDAEFAKETYWYADGVEGDIIAYRVVAEPGVYLDWETPDGSEGEVFPEGVTKYTEVSVIQRDGGWFTSFGDGFCWDSDIVAYRIVSASSGDSGNPEAEPARDFVRIETQESQAPPYSQKHEEPVDA